jgi:hypothetical protein
LQRGRAYDDDDDHDGDDGDVMMLMTLVLCGVVGLLFSCTDLAYALTGSLLGRLQHAGLTPKAMVRKIEK